jgi:sulfur dioxygenase
MSKEAAQVAKESSCIKYLGKFTRKSMTNQNNTLGYSGDITPSQAHDWWQSGEAVLIDIRTHAERAWAGFIPNVPGIEFKIWPGMAINPAFDAQLQDAMQGKTKKVMLLCRSGIRSIPAAQRAQALGFEAYNILEGFEGDPDSKAHRNTLGGWRAKGLPWAQN